MLKASEVAGSGDVGILRGGGRSYNTSSATESGRGLSDTFLILSGGKSYTTSSIVDSGRGLSGRCGLAGTGGFSGTEGLSGGCGFLLSGGKSYTTSCLTGSGVSCRSDFDGDGRGLVATVPVGGATE